MLLMKNKVLWRENQFPKALLYIMQPSETFMIFTTPI
jgi:hypothetical protein